MQTTYIDLPELHLAISKKEERTSGHTAVRELCRLLLKRLNWDDSVDETSLPYRLTHSKNIVSYTHSNQRVAVVIAKNNPTTHDLVGLGIDVEDNDVSMKVAKRFFSDKEVVWLENLSENDKQQATNLLWMAKEAIIKTQASSGVTVKGQLLTGLSFNILNEFPGFSSLFAEKAKNIHMLQSACHHEKKLYTSTLKNYAVALNKKKSS